MAPLTLYYFDASPPCRSVLLAIKLLNLNVTLETIDFFGDEQLKPWFRQINPAHTMPTLKDNGEILWESRTILRYLVTKYGKDDKLYPNDPVKRIHVDKMLDFDLGTLYRAIEIYFEVYMNEERAPNEKETEKVSEKLSVFNTILQDSPFAAGKEMTIADISLIVTMATVEVFDFDVKNKYPDIYKWSENVKRQLPFFQEVNFPGLKEFSQYFDDKKKHLREIGILS